MLRLKEARESLMQRAHTYNETNKWTKLSKYSTFLLIQYLLLEICCLFTFLFFSQNYVKTNTIHPIAYVMFMHLNEFRTFEK